MGAIFLKCFCNSILLPSSFTLGVHWKSEAWELQEAQICRNRNLEEFEGRTVGSPCLEFSMILAIALLKLHLGDIHNTLPSDWISFGEENYMLHFLHMGEDPFCLHCMYVCTHACMNFPPVPFLCVINYWLIIFLILVKIWRDFLG